MSRVREYNPGRDNSLHHCLMNLSPVSELKNSRFRLRLSSGVAASDCELESNDLEDVVGVLILRGG